MPDGQPWSLLVGDYRFGAGPEDIALLAAMGSLAAHAGGPFLAEAAPELLGADSAAALADPGQWAPLAAGNEQNWPDSAIGSGFDARLETHPAVGKARRGENRRVG
jgi:predicted component of type VI protein secretion system